MNVRSLYRLSWAIESILDDVKDGGISEEEEIELLIDAKRLAEMMVQELNNYIVRMVKE